MRKILSTAVVAAAATALVIPATSAFAGSATVNDSQNDVWKSTNESDYTKAGQGLNVDIDKATVKHTTKRVETVVHYASLKKDDRAPFVFVGVKTDGGDYGMVAQAYKGPDGWVVEGGAFPEGVSRGGGESCTGFKASVDWDSDDLVLSAPRSCFGNPAWIKGHVEASTYESANDKFTNYFDNAHNDKHNQDGWTSKVKRG